MPVASFLNKGILCSQNRTEAVLSSGELTLTVLDLVFITLNLSLAFGSDMMVPRAWKGQAFVKVLPLAQASILMKEERWPLVVPPPLLLCLLSEI